MAAGYPARQAWVLGRHGRGRCPGRIDALVGDGCHALPPVLIARNGDGIADRLAPAADEVKPAIAEAHDDLAGCVLRAEAHDLAAAVTDDVAAAPVPEEELGRGLARSQRDQQERGHRDGCAAAATGGDHGGEPSPSRGLSSSLTRTPAPACKFVDRLAESCNRGGVWLPWVARPRRSKRA